MAWGKGDAIVMESCDLHVADGETSRRQALQRATKRSGGLAGLTLASDRISHFLLRLTKSIVLAHQALCEFAARAQKRDQEHII